MDAGVIRNTATVNGQTPAGAVADDDTLATPLTKTPGVTIVKSSNASAATEAGDIVTFNFVVTNTGNVTITSFVVTDPLPGLSAIDCGGVTSLAPLATVTCTATYTVTQADVDAGVDRQHGGRQRRDRDRRAGDRRPTPSRRRCTKTPGSRSSRAPNATPATKAGDTITFSFLVTNTGNVTITSFVVTDPLPGLSAINCGGVTSLAPTASVSCSATYVVTQADVDAGVINNTATVNGTTATAGPVTDDDTLATPLTTTPSVTIVKSSNATATTAAGDTITFSFVVTNTGNVTITSFVVTDPLVGLSAIDCGAAASLAPGDSATCTATYMVTQADVDAGAISNTGDRRTGRPSSGPVTDDDIHLTTLTSNPELTLIKSGVLDMTVVRADRPRRRRRQRSPTR